MTAMPASPAPVFSALVQKQETKGRVKPGREKKRPLFVGGGANGDQV